MKKINDIIAVDIDDTILDLMSTWLSMYNADYYDNLQKNQITDWNIAQFVKPEARDAIYDYIHFSHTFTESIPIEYSWQGINLLKSMDFRIVYVTANNPDGCKYGWLKKYGFIENHEDFVHALDKSLIHCEYMIDDNYDNIINGWGRGMIYNQPWNLKYEHYPKIKNWSEFISDIKNKDIIL